MSPPRSFRLLAALTLLAAACARTTMVESSAPLEIRGRLPAPPPPELAAVDQPAPPPPRVVLEGELVRLDEAIAFEGDLMAGDSLDIVAAIAAWLVAQPGTTPLTIEVSSAGKGSRKHHAARSKLLAQRVLEGLVAAGAPADRLRASGLGKSPDDLTHVVLRMADEERPQ